MKSAPTVEFFFGGLFAVYVEKVYKPLLLKYRHLVVSQVGRLDRHNVGIILRMDRA